MLKFFLLLFPMAVFSSPLPSKDVERVLYDQRQEGEWNVRADLKNFVILIIPTQSSTSTPAAGGALLDLLSKAVPKRSHMKKFQKKQQQDPAQDTRHFIESKSAPYQVDISKSKNQLAKLHPELPTVVKAEEVVIAKSPTIELVQEETDDRGTRAFVLTVPEKLATKAEDKEDKKKMRVSELMLLGAENEQCGPGLIRDSEGVCRTIKNN